MKRTLLLLLAVCMMVTMIPAASFAFDGQGQDDMVLTAEEPEAPAAEEQGAPEAEQEEEFFYESKMRLSEGEDGWTQDPSTLKWLYYKDGVPLTGKQPIGGSYYYFDKSGFLTTGWVTISKGKYYFDPTPGVPGAAGSTYGVMKTGWLSLDANQYYLDPKTGKMQTGWKTIDKYKYYFDTSTGKMKTGWLTLSGAKYYLDPVTGRMHTGWLEGKHKYYLNPDTGKMVTGMKTIAGKKYYFNPKNGRMKSGCWLTYNGYKYYLNKNGSAKTGWATIQKEKYWFDTTTARMQKKWKTISGKTYYFGTNGKMVTGFKTISKKKYYFDTKGAMKKNGLYTIKGYKYYFNKDGVMKTNGTQKISGRMYYFFASGKAPKTAGWFKGSDKKQRYCLGGGKIATGEKKIGNVIYVFSTTTGVLLRSMDTVDQRIQNVKSDTAYLIQVVKNKHQVRIYKGKKGAWVRQYTFTCSVGDVANPTPEGTFKIYKKLNKHEVKDPLTGVKVRCWGLCRFAKVKDPNTGKTKEIALNSIIYRASDGSVYDGKLGLNNSRGSVRMTYNNAMWVFYNIPLNTAVYVK